jgi:hypothetical protein
MLAYAVQRNIISYIETITMHMQLSTSYLLFVYC